MTREEEYNEMYLRFQNKEITLVEWVEYLEIVLDELLEKNGEVLLRLKG